MILVLTYVVAALILGGYIAWFVYRYRRDQRAKAVESDRAERQFRSAMPSAEPRTTAPDERPPLPTMPSASRAVPTTAAVEPSAPSGVGARTVASALSGISMPHDLVPLTTIAPRPGVVDQVAFVSRSSVSVIGPLFADELERLGFALTPLDEQTLAAKRGDDNLMVYIHAEPPPSAPEGSVVIEVCVPY